MTHGEEPGPETHKDSAVLTYLEGLLMHPVVAGPGATAGGRSEASNSNQEQGNKVGGPLPLPNHDPMVPKAGTNGPKLGSSQHLKKARLLRSGAWNDPGNQRMSSPPVELNGQVGTLQNGALEGSPHSGESTLLASLLQSFSSRLQSVAMSQHSNKPTGECSSPSKAPATDKEPLPVYGTASSRLKGLMRKSKLQNHNNTPYSRRGHSQDRPPESPRSAHSATPPAAPAATDSVSCAERLKAVANMVKIRSSPAPSPKPSVACSQLALLLSSEAHLQQYSREHALKAQLSGRSASERLAAMANQQHGQDKRPPSVGGSSDTVSSLSTQNGMTTATITTTLPRTAATNPQSPSLQRGHSQNSPPTPPHAPSLPTREKRGFDTRPTRPPQTCSSLLLLLLNNHNNQKQLTKNGHLEDISGLLPPSGSSSVTSDSECSVHDRSNTKDSSDAESSYSSCSPIDLSMRGRSSLQDTGPKSTPPSSSSSSMFSSTTAFSSPPVTISPQAPTQPPTTSFSPSSMAVSSVSYPISSSSSSFSTSSLDKLTESLLNKWKPEPSRSTVSKNKEPEMNPDLKSHPKVTLMQLLLERRNNEMANKSTGRQDSPLDITMANMSRNQQKGSVTWEEGPTKSPIERPAGPSQSVYSLSRDTGAAQSPYSYPSPHVQSSPLDLCKSKTFPADKASEPAFSASKLLQNLAQCGTTSPPPPISSGKGASQELNDSRPHALLERLNTPVNRTTPTPLSDGASGSSTPFSRKEPSPPSSQIENLLERRTVLQLLLGTGSTGATAGRKERPSGSGHGTAEMEGGCFERSPTASILCDSSNGSPLDVKIKSELTEDVGSSLTKSEDLSGKKRLSSYGKNSPLFDSQQDLKTEPRPAEFIAKYGLLSQLLKQQTTTYYSSAATMQPEPQSRQVKEEHRDYPNPSPKRRRLCSEHTDSLNSISSPRAVDSGNANMSASSTVQADPEQQRSLKEEELPPRSPMSETLTRESRGFNVLKQLLLSDNCLKELSQQPRQGPSPSILQTTGKANGNILSQPTQNHNFLHLPSWHTHGSLNSGLPNHIRPLPTPPEGNNPIRPASWIRQPVPWPATQKREPPTLIKQEPESPIRWSSQENDGMDEGCESNPDSPRLSRSNPILYYMLQKGNIQLRKEAPDQAEGARPVVRVKEEPVSDMHTYERSLSSTPQSPTHNDKHSHEGQGLSQSSQ
ncbi:nuclear receptor-interacting protein 1 [Poecilia formosa]|uniref:nuclear receptor-interacting protein 1 n=1 Tax=Poecilia formosa TaxID=48698 RepID=UPI000444319F|nr:PREDICTED: nuclear receptor-interacting protein 1 [Poecilia formosa]XP_007556481.1 PREDICTED: nuclear receptor-interacting protein 1 [Poecilia formosa]